MSKSQSKPPSAVKNLSWVENIRLLKRQKLVVPLVTALYIPYVCFCSFSVPVVLYFQHLQLEVGTVVVAAAFFPAISSHRVGTAAAGMHEPFRQQQYPRYKASSKILMVCFHAPISVGQVYLPLGIKENFGSRTARDG